MTHSKQPWIIRENAGVLQIRSDLVYSRRDIVALIKYPVEQDRINFNRIIECVNACEGIENVAEFIETAKQLMQSKKENEAIRKIVNEG